jgi:hypothetical protein
MGGISAHLCKAADFARALRGHADTLEPKDHALLGLALFLLADGFFAQTLSHCRRFFVPLALFHLAIKTFFLGFSFCDAQCLFHIVVADNYFDHDAITPFNRAVWLIPRIIAR